MPIPAGDTVQVTFWFAVPDTVAVSCTLCPPPIAAKVGLIEMATGVAIAAVTNMPSVAKLLGSLGNSNQPPTAVAAAL